MAAPYSWVTKDRTAPTAKWPRRPVAKWPSRPVAKCLADPPRNGLLTCADGGGRCRRGGRPADRAGASEPRREDDRDDRQQDDDGHHGVHLGQLLAEPDCAEDPQRQRVLRAGGE